VTLHYIKRQLSYNNNNNNNNNNLGTKNI